MTGQCPGNVGADGHGPGRRKKDAEGKMVGLLGFRSTRSLPRTRRTMTGHDRTMSRERRGGRTRTGPQEERRGREDGWAAWIPINEEPAADKEDNDRT